MLPSKSYVFAGIFLSCILALGAENSAPQNFKLYVGNSRGDDITVIDTKNRKPIVSIPVGRIPWGVVIDD